MEKRNKKMELITTMWAPLALEYSKFLNRYKLETICIVRGRTTLGYDISIFADGDAYWKLSQTNNQFNKEEDQITELLATIKDLTGMIYLFSMEDEWDCDDEEDYELDYMISDDEED